MNSMKSQSESLAKEYDRLDLDFSYIMKKLDIFDNQIDGGEG